MKIELEDPARASFLAWILYRILLRRPPRQGVRGTYEVRSAGTALTLVVAPDSVRILPAPAPRPDARLSAPLDVLTEAAAGRLPWRALRDGRLRFRGSLRRLLWLARALRTP